MFRLNGLFLASLFICSLFNVKTANATFGAERLGSLLTRHFPKLLERQDQAADLGACGGDTACTPSPFGCDCRWADENGAYEGTEPTEEESAEESPEPEKPTAKNAPLDPPGNHQCEPEPADTPKDALRDRDIL